MLVKDQLLIRMEELKMPVSELAKRVGVSSQSVRYWLTGRSFPGKAKCSLVEEALSFKLDFSEGSSTQSITVEQTLKQSNVNTLQAISRLPLDVQLLFAKLANAYARTDAAQPEATTNYQVERAVVQHPSAPGKPPVNGASTAPPHPANPGQVAGRVTRKTQAR